MRGVNLTERGGGICGQGARARRKWRHKRCECSRCAAHALEELVHDVGSGAWVVHSAVAERLVVQVDHKHDFATRVGEQREPARSSAISRWLQGPQPFLCVLNCGHTLAAFVAQRCEHLVRHSIRLVAICSAHEKLHLEIKCECAHLIGHIQGVIALELGQRPCRGQTPEQTDYDRLERLDLKDGHPILRCDMRAY